MSWSSIRKSHSLLYLRRRTHVVRTSCEPMGPHTMAIETSSNSTHCTFLTLVTPTDRTLVSNWMGHAIVGMICVLCIFYEMLNTNSLDVQVLRRLDRGWILWTLCNCTLASEANRIGHGDHTVFPPLCDDIYVACYSRMKDLWRSIWLGLWWDRYHLFLLTLVYLRRRRVF